MLLLFILMLYIDLDNSLKYLDFVMQLWRNTSICCKILMFLHSSETKFGAKNLGCNINSSYIAKTTSLHWLLKF